jgi:D-xylose transport system ATP-binding protein
MKNGKVVSTERVADLTQDDVLSMIILGRPPQRQHATTLPQVTPTSSAASIGPA